MVLLVGDLIRWITDWGVYVASEKGVVFSDFPEYTYGLVIEVLSDLDGERVAIVSCLYSESSFHKSGNTLVLRFEQDGIEVISRARQGE